jgi:hypothetical protein
MGCIAVSVKIENMLNRLALSNILAVGELLTLRLDKDIFYNPLKLRICVDHCVDNCVYQSIVADLTHIVQQPN